MVHGRIQKIVFLQIEDVLSLDLLQATQEAVAPGNSSASTPSSRYLAASNAKSSIGEGLMFGIQDNAMSTVWPIDAEQFEKWVPAILEVVAAVDENGEGAYLHRLTSG